MYTYQFYRNDELDELIKEHSDKFAYSIEYLENGNFITFSDAPLIEKQPSENEQAEKILNLETRIKELEDGLIELAGLI